LYLGSGYQLQRVAEQDEPLKLKDGRFLLRRPVLEQGGPAAARQAFEAFYAQKGLEWLHHRDHSDAFWNEVDKVLPDHRERKEWLRVRGAALDL
jgi:hypothetical protein